MDRTYQDTQSEPQLSAGTLYACDVGDTTDRAILADMMELNDRPTESRYLRSPNPVRVVGRSIQVQSLRTLDTNDPHGDGRGDCQCVTLAVYRVWIDADGQVADRADFVERMPRIGSGKSKHSAGEVAKTSLRGDMLIEMYMGEWGWFPF